MPTYHSAVEKLKIVIPGDKLAVIEEFGPGEGTYMNGDVIRASKSGEVNYELKKREVRVKSLQKTRIPTMDDSIIGQVDAAQSNIASVRIYYINDEKSPSSFTGMLILKPESSIKKGKRMAIICKPGDIIRAKVTSYKNAIVHLSIDGKENGVIYATCSSCGGNVNKIDQRIKCVDCGLIEDRKLALDFGKAQLK
ncbi:MAG: exosome complex RNA-binding protein Csl4 [Nitrososphaerales archaeon]